MNHYTVQNGIQSIEDLKGYFPQGKCDEMNIVLFSTSGIHGTYNKIEDLCFDTTDEDFNDHLTIQVIQPRKVYISYGHIKVSLDDIDFLKSLRESARLEFCNIG